MKQITATGQTVEEAVQSALEQLQTSRDLVEVEIIDEGKKGFLGFGSKPSIVKVSKVHAKEETPEQEVNTELKKQETVPDININVQAETEESETELPAHDPIEEAERYIKAIASDMGASVEVKTTVNGREVHFELIGDKIALLIGKRGQTLNALQYLLHLTINRYTDQYYTAVLDAEGYRNRRKATLETLASRLSEKALKSNQDVKLEPMPSYERKIIHTALQNNRKVETYSAGNEPKRYVVIRPSK
ncbi:Jag protein [Thalassobacillus devorans]|uniref:RNA-binding protein KhpB n=1 Tax=Thalassobacillus devorans TaxID=279813 RepID=A0ABQ1PD40_9BACI|nr:RNA-binding cell elongation regulator Jag/EloR [Thalassobacillus devorans]NIK29198.1 spoIIIJ-associated protein [Thalassobacillus devorans]GGC94858.1 Jag protein [Thalassobacillus devorans]